MTFWIVAIAIAAAAGAVLLAALLKVRVADDDGGVGLYRDQLAEVARDRDRGVIDAAEAERARIEISRRLLEADRARAGAAEGPGRGPVLLPALLIGAAILGAFAAYAWHFGVPGYPDLPIADRIARAEAVHADRPSQAAAEAEAKGSLPAPATPGPDFLKLIDRLRAALAEKPDDVTGQRLLARNEAALGNFAAAEAAGRKVIDLLGPKAGPNDYASLADTMILATGGYVSPEAEALLAKALALDPVNGTARFYMGLMWAQTGRPDRAFALWRALLEEGPENAPWMREIRPRIAFLARAAGVDYTAPPAPDAAPGPGAADIAAAADMSPEDRRQMIRAMVERLNARLADEGGPAEDWARLISSLTVLGETDRAAAILAEAETRFAGHDADLAKIRAAAVAQPGGAPFAGGGTALPGPDAGQVAAAGEMTPDERRTMIAGMVDQLSDRLMSEGGSAEEWARLVTSLGVLGETARAKEAYGKGRAALAGDAAGLATLEAAARAAGLAG